jgi:hypothetical protein
MKTATVELEAGGVGCHGQFVNLDLRWFLVLVVESWREAAYKGFFCERRKCDGAPPAVRWRCTAVQVHRRRCTAVHGGASCTSAGRARLKKRIGGPKKGAHPLSRIFLVIG